MQYYVGLDVHKETIAVSVAEEGRGGLVRYVGTIANRPDTIAAMADKLSHEATSVNYCYEAGGCGYTIYRQLTELGYPCIVVAPTKIPKKPGDRIKTDRRDSEKLAVLHRYGELTPVWVPDETHEAMRDLVRARTDASIQLMRCRQQLLAFLLRHRRYYESGRKNWTQRHRVWLASQTFEQPAHQMVFQDYVEAVWTAQNRCDELIKRITSLIPEWSLGHVVQALRGLRGIDTISAVTFVASVGDLKRFEHPEHLMSYLGLVPSEHSSGNTIRRGAITKTGNREARRMLVEAAWCYRYPARVAQDKAEVLIKLPKSVRDIAWNAQQRLCRRYRTMHARGKKPNVVATAIARELAGFIWAIGQEMQTS